jgi:hypothetical protein
MDTTFLEVLFTTTHYLFVGLFGSSSLRKHLLDSLLFFQQEGSHDALLDTDAAATSSVDTRDGTFSLLHGMVFGGSNVLDSLKRRFAITTLGSLGLFVDTLGH